MSVHPRSQLPRYKRLSTTSRRSAQVEDEEEEGKVNSFVFLSVEKKLRDETVDFRRSEKASNVH